MFGFIGIGHGTWDMGHGTLDTGHGTWDIGHGTWDMVHGNPRWEAQYLLTKLPTLNLVIERSQGFSHPAPWGGPTQYILFTT